MNMIIYVMIFATMVFILKMMKIFVNAKLILLVRNVQYRMKILIYAIVVILRKGIIQ